MKTLISPFATALIIIIFVNACSQQQRLVRPYPLWGKPVFLQKDADDQRLLQIKSPESAETAEACLLIVHGMNEYGGRYTHVANYFADRYIVAGIDLTAHGLSNPVFAQAQNTLDTTTDISQAFLQQAELADLQAMRDDFDQALHYMLNHCQQQQTNRPLPLFVLSHSLGSLVSASYLINQDTTLKQNIAGIIFSGPAFSVTSVPGWRGWFQNPFIRFTYHTHKHFLNPHNEALPLLLFNQLLALITVPIQDGIIELLSLPGFRQLFSPSTPDWVINYLSNWEQERAYHRLDPYIIRRSVLRYVLAVGKEVIRFREKMADFDVPYLLIYSEHDPITPAWGSQDFTTSNLENHPDNDVMLLTNESHHEQLFSTPELRHQVLQKISSWINRRIIQQPD